MQKLISILCVVIASTTVFADGGTSSIPSLRKNAEWARGIVWYQIFPERFHNGDASNDPVASEIPETNGYPGWQISPWTSDWYEMQPWEQAQSDSFYSFKVVFARRYGGDLIGVIEKLDYLKDLGIDGIYFNPVFEAKSLHKYDGASFHHIDDNFGPDPKGDRNRLMCAQETEDPASWIWTKADSTFLHLIEEAHRREIKVIIDGVFNHTGRAFFAFHDILENGKASHYAHWYDIISWDNPDTPENEFNYKAWWDVKTLPEFSEDENGLGSGPREYVLAITKRWMDPNGDGNPDDGVDGWRLDVINEVAFPFWEEWSALVRSLNPEAIMIAEIWDDASAWIKAGIDNTMNYLFARSTVDFFVDRKTGFSGNQFAEKLQNIITLYGKDRAHILWNLIDSHDTDRLASIIVNPERDYDRDNRPYQNPNYEVRKPNALERQIHKQIAAFQMTMIGAPMIYYGDEAGLWGADDPDDRKPMLWPELTYDIEKQHPLPGYTRPEDPVAFDRTLFDYYKQMIRLRHQFPALMQGDFQIIQDLISDHVIAFIREARDQQAICIFNRGDDSQEIQIPVSIVKYRLYRDVIQDPLYKVNGDGISIDVKGRWYVVLISE